MKTVTDILHHLPVSWSKPVERLVLGLASGPAVDLVRRRELSALRRVRRLQRLLVIADTNIGDAIVLRPAVVALHKLLPATAIDFACNARTSALVAPDPSIRTAFPVLSGGSGRCQTNTEAIREIVDAHPYDLIVNFCPFIDAHDLRGAGCPVVMPVSLIAEVLRAYVDGTPAALSYQVERWAHRFAGACPAGGAPGPFTPIGTGVLVSEVSLARSRRFLRDCGVSEHDPVVFVNPDTSNDSTFLGAGFLSELTRGLLDTTESATVVLGRGFKYRGIEQEILSRVGGRDRLHLAPDQLTLEDLAALIDTVRVYIGGDTGPLHIAAARKDLPGGGAGPVNRTSVVGIFKATEPRVYGYDSHRDDMIPAHQAAPSRTFVWAPPCKSLTCSLQRVIASCPAVECQESLRVGEVLAYVVARLQASPDADPGRQTEPFALPRASQIR
jgi:ADP-heptose:LPS heptosyltransferase